MSKKFCLSDKLDQWTYPKDGLLSVTHVKEFIRRLKNILGNVSGDDIILNYIDKLAGEKLI